MRHSVGPPERLLPVRVVLLQFISETSCAIWKEQLMQSQNEEEKRLTWTSIVEKATFMKAMDGVLQPSL